MTARAATPDPELRAAIEEGGWWLESVEEGDVWWCRELWHLKSTWRPQEREAFLCFLVDPQEESRIPTPWTVKVSLRRPTNWMQQSGEFTVSIRGPGQSWIPGLISCLNTLRNLDAS